MVTEEYLLENLCCADCASKIEEQVANLDTVDSAHLDFIKKKLTVKIKNNIDVEHKIKRIVKLIEPDIRISQLSQLHAPKPKYIEVSLLTSFIGVTIAVLVYVLKLTETPKIVLLLSAYLLSSWKVLFNAFVKAMNGRLLDEHFLMCIASIGAIYLGDYSEAIAVMVLYEVGQYFENKAVNQSRNSIQKMLNLKPDVVHRVMKDKVSDVPIADIAVNELIAVLPGERIPLDGIIIEGQSTLDTAALTGEALPLACEIGHSVLSGSMNLTGKIILKVTSIDSESTVSRIMKLVESATQKKSLTEKFITRFARKYTPAVVLAAILIALIPPVLMRASFNMWFERSLIFLIVSCPCALIISVPLTNYAAIGAAAKKGILFKGSNFIDALSRARTFVYDKTGTLTTGKLKIKDLLPAEGVTEDTLASVALTCEENSNHPLAKAVMDSLSQRFSFEPAIMHQEFHGKGIQIQTKDHIYYAGSKDFISGYNIKNLPSEPSETCIYLADKSSFLGIITFTDDIKADFPFVIKQLRKLGVRNHIVLSGDHQTQVSNVAKELKLGKFYAKLLPDAKMDIYEKIMLSTKSPVAFIGDGLNDAPVLSRAEIGIAMGAGGNQIAIEAADIVLMQDQPLQLLNTLRLARKTKNILWQNIILALGIKAVVIVLGTFGMASLWEAVIADVGVTLMAIANSSRLLRI